MRKAGFFLFLIICTGAAAQEQKTEQKFGINFTGFVKTDIFYDTRQSSAANGIREGHFFLFPDNRLNDANGTDLNANPSLHMLNIQTRIKGDITGPDFLGGKTSGLIEAEFFGTSESDLNGFRLRHAYVKVDWNSTSLLSGQFWHPMFPAESFPGTLSFNTGAPFTPFSRNPQVRVTQKAGILSATGTIYSQRDFVSPGPDGNSNKYLRNAGIPGANLQIRISPNDRFVALAGADYKKLRPELRTAMNTESETTVGGLSLFLNAKLKTNVITVTAMSVYGQNCADLMMLGGYAVSDVAGAPSFERQFTTINNFTAWSDIAANLKKFNVGLFTGYSKNLGSSETINGTVYARGNNIDHLFRLSPRVTFTEGKLTLGAEMESTAAAYGTMENDGKVINTENIVNHRFLLTTIYRF